MQPLIPNATEPSTFPERATRLGVGSSLTHQSLQMDIYKELINKLAWAVGSTYRQPYGNRGCLARSTAQAVANEILKAHGYPAHIGLK